jgi:hypothetical protein
MAVVAMMMIWIPKKTSPYHPTNDDESDKKAAAHERKMRYVKDRKLTIAPSPILPITRNRSRRLRKHYTPSLQPS